MASDSRLTATSEDAVHPVLQRKFVPLDEVERVFSITKSQAYALVRSGALRAIRVGGRGQWRIELAEIEEYIRRAYAATEEFLGEEAEERSEG